MLTPPPGSYGDVSRHPRDLQYIRHLVQFARSALGPTAVLMTTDGGNTGYMRKGTLNDSSVLSLGDGCTPPGPAWAAEGAFNPLGLAPKMCSEFYTGWLTHWGDPHAANTSTALVASNLDAVLSTANGSVSLYMGHGGTSFGWWSGVNGAGGTSFQPDVTSYDYGSPVAEGGEQCVALPALHPVWIPSSFLGLRTVLCLASVHHPHCNRTVNPNPILLQWVWQ